MNQEPRRIKRTCFICKENAVWIRQVYNPHISDWADCAAPICEKCKRKMESESLIRRTTAGAGVGRI